MSDASTQVRTYKHRKSTHIPIIRRRTTHYYYIKKKINLSLYFIITLFWRIIIFRVGSVSLPISSNHKTSSTLMFNIILTLALLINGFILSFSIQLENTYDSFISLKPMPYPLSDHSVNAMMDHDAMIIIGGCDQDQVFRFLIFNFIQIYSNKLFSFRFVGLNHSILQRLVQMWLPQQQNYLVFVIIVLINVQFITVLFLFLNKAGKLKYFNFFINFFTVTTDSWKSCGYLQQARYRHMSNNFLFVPFFKKYYILFQLIIKSIFKGAYLNQKVYVFGGREINDILITTIEVYDTLTDQWSVSSDTWPQATSDGMFFRTENHKLFFSFKE